MWEATKTQYIFYGWILIRRHEGTRPAATGRAQAGKNFTGRPMEWLLEWESAVRAPGGTAMLLESRPADLPVLRIARRSPCARRKIRRAGIHIGDRCSRLTARVQCPGWLAQIVAECDGVKTWRELFAWAQEAGIVGPGGIGGGIRAGAAAVDVDGNSAPREWTGPRLNLRGVHRSGQARNTCTEFRHSTAVGTKIGH